MSCWPRRGTPVGDLSEAAQRRENTQEMLQWTEPCGFLATNGGVRISVFFASLYLRSFFIILPKVWAIRHAANRKHNRARSLLVQRNVSDAVSALRSLFTLLDG